MLINHRNEVMNERRGPPLGIRGIIFLTHNYLGCFCRLICRWTVLKMGLMLTALMSVIWGALLLWGEGELGPGGAPQSRSMREAAVRNPVCVDKYCFNDEECCEGAACVSHERSKVGICLQLFDRSEGKLCHSNAECASSLKCVAFHPEYTPLGICSGLEGESQKQYFDECLTTQECDSTRGLCCRLMHRKAVGERKLCSYYTDLLAQCIF